MTHADAAHESASAHTIGLYLDDEAAARARAARRHRLNVVQIPALRLRLLAQPLPAARYDSWLGPILRPGRR
jgi:hypothetical protein